MRRKHHFIVPPVVALGHLILLVAMFGARPHPAPSAEQIFVLSLVDGDTVGPLPGPASGAPAPASEPAAEPASSAAAEPPVATPPQEPPPSENAAPAEPPPAAAEPALAASPDLTAEAADADPADAAALLASLVSPAPAGPAVATAAAGGGAGDACRLAEWLQTTLELDPEVRASMARVPEDARSVANAVMLWDGAWVEVRDARGADVLATVRMKIIQRLLAVPPACRDAVVVGPRFIAVSEPAPATVLAIGSGLWRWSDLLPAANGFGFSWSGAIPVPAVMRRPGVN